VTGWLARSQKNRDGTLTEAEHAEMANYVRVGTFLNLMQAKARHSLSFHA